ncbi:MAG: hypothetical protein KAI17_02500, partial [Thiotrichaceae bacterium]|nr:hypothetical protein [Thiotrichaceae bacterium]
TREFFREYLIKRKSASQGILMIMALFTPPDSAKTPYHHKGTFAVPPPSVVVEKEESKAVPVLPALTLDVLHALV